MSMNIIPINVLNNGNMKKTIEEFTVQCNQAHLPNLKINLKTFSIEKKKRNKIYNWKHVRNNQQMFETKVYLKVFASSIEVEYLFILLFGWW